jgi:hypothetical protein
VEDHKCSLGIKAGYDKATATGDKMSRSETLRTRVRNQMRHK